MADPGEVYWSERAGQFYQVGRRGSVSRDEGVRFIEYNPRTGKYLDDRGNVVPDTVLSAVRTRVRRFVGKDLEGRPFLKTTFTDRSVTRTQAVQHAYQGNQLLVVRVVIRLPNGKVMTQYTSAPAGRVPNVDSLLEQARQRAQGVTREHSPTPAGWLPGSEIIETEFIIRTVNVLGRS